MDFACKVAEYAKACHRLRLKCRENKDFSNDYMYIYRSPQFPPDFMSPAVSPMNRSQAEGLMQSVIPLENQLTSLVTQGVCGAQGLQKLLDLR